MTEGPARRYPMPSQPREVLDVIRNAAAGVAAKR
jgi:hypothetical protein